MARRQYTEEDRARVFVSLSVHSGNVKRAARETDIPVSTVRMWKTDWERQGGPGDEILAAAEAQAEKFVEDSGRVRDKVLARIEELIDTGEVAMKDLKSLATAYGVLTDKINTAKGLTRKSDSQAAIDPAAMRELAKGLVEGAISAAHKREQEILVAEDADYTELQPAELPRGTS